MEIIDYSIEWARGEVFSSKVITLISVFVLLCAAGFYFWGKTAMARAYWMPLAVSGVFLIVVAGGLYYANHPRITNFQEQYKGNAELFVKSELERTAKSDRDLNNIVYLKSATYRVSWEFTCKTTKILLLYIFLGHNRNVVNTKFPYPIKRLEVIRRFNQKSMAFNQSLS